MTVTIISSMIDFIVRTDIFKTVDKKLLAKQWNTQT